MVALNLCEFAAAFNYALRTQRRCFTVHSTVTNRRFALYLRRAGYISGLRRIGAFLEVYPLYGHFHFLGITAISSPSRPIFFGIHKIRKELRGGNRYIMFSHTGYFCDSHECLLSNVGGQALVRLS
jgi:ribosomal protein S8